MNTLIDLATKHHCVIIQCARLERSIGSAIATRLRPRIASNVYQNVAFNIPNIPREFASSLFGSSGITVDTPTKLTWAFTTVPMVAKVVNALLACSSYASSCEGLTRAFRTASQSCTRVVAAILPGAVAHEIKTPNPYADRRGGGLQEPWLHG